MQIRDEKAALLVLDAHLLSPRVALFGSKGGLGSRADEGADVVRSGARGLARCRGRGEECDDTITRLNDHTIILLSPSLFLYVCIHIYIYIYIYIIRGAPASSLTVLVSIRLPPSPRKRKLWRRPHALHRGAVISGRIRSRAR